MYLFMHYYKNKDHSYKLVLLYSPAGLHEISEKSEPLTLGPGGIITNPLLLVGRPGYRTLTV